MAQSNSDKVGKLHEKFEDANSGMVESLYEIDPNSVNLDSPEVAKIMDETVRARVKKEMPNYQMRFGSALAKEKAKGIEDKDAYKRAFNAVFAGALRDRSLKTVKEVDKSDGTGKELVPDEDIEAKIVEKLKGKMKFEIDPETKLAGRKELTVAALRLRSAVDRGWVCGEVKERKGKYARRKEELSAEIGKLEKTEEIISKVDVSAKQKGIRARVARIEGIRGTRKKDLSSLDDRVKADSEQYTDYHNHAEKLGLDLDSLITALTTDYSDKFDTPKLTKLLEKFKRLNGYRLENKDYWLEFLDKDLNSFLADSNLENINDLILRNYIGQIRVEHKYLVENKLALEKAALYHSGVYKTDKNVKLQLGHLIEQDDTSLIAPAQVMLALLKASAEALPELQADVEFSVKVPDLAQKCADLSTKLAELDTCDPRELYDKVVQFIAKVYDPFIQAIGKPAAQNRADLTAKRAELATVNGDIARLESFKESDFSVDAILDKAFEDAHGGKEMVGLREVVRNAEHHKHEVDEVYKQLSDHSALEKVGGDYQQLSRLVAELKASQKRKLDDLGGKISQTDARLKAEPNPSQNKLLERELRQLKKAQGKAGLPINARIEYLKEALRSNAVKSDDAIEKSLNAQQELARKEGRSKDFDRDKVRDAMEEQNEAKKEQNAAYSEELRLLNLIVEQSKKFREPLAKLIDNLAKAEHMGIDLDIDEKTLQDLLTALSGGLNKTADTTPTEKVGPEFHTDGAGTGHSEKHLIRQLGNLLQQINVTNGDFDPEVLTRIYGVFDAALSKHDKFAAFLEKFHAEMASSNKAVDDSKATLESAEKENGKLKGMTDEDPAMRILVAIIDKYCEAGILPKMSQPEKYQVAEEILKKDQALMRLTDDYGKLADRASAELVEVVHHFGFRSKVINFKYAVGDKTFAPFAGLKPEQLADWKSIEKLFEPPSKLNRENATFLLAAYEMFDAGVPSVQAIRLREKIIGEMAKAMHVEDRMHVDGIADIVNKAFEAQMKESRALVKAHFDEMNDAKITELDQKQVENLERECQILMLEKKLGEIESEGVYQMKLNALVEKAKKLGLADRVKFSESTVLADLWNSDFSGWLKEWGHNMGEKAKARAKGTGKGMLKAAGKSVWGGTKWSVGLGLNSGVRSPFVFAKWGLMGVGNVLARGINLFRVKKLSVPKIFGKEGVILKDLSRAWNYTKAKAKAIPEGFQKDFAKPIGEGWTSGKKDKVKTKDRADLKAKLAKLRLEAKELGKLADIKAVETSKSPFIDLAPYMKDISEINTMMGYKPSVFKHGAGSVAEIQHKPEVPAPVPAPPAAPVHAHTPAVHHEAPAAVAASRHDKPVEAADHKKAAGAGDKH